MGFKNKNKKKKIELTKDDELSNINENIIVSDNNSEPLKEEPKDKPEEILEEKVEEVPEEEEKVEKVPKEEEKVEKEFKSLKELNSEEYRFYLNTGKLPEK